MKPRVLIAEPLDFCPEAAEVLARVAEFVKLITKAIEEYEGAVVNILSDTVMATFTGQDDAQHAVAAAQEIQSGFAALAEAWDRDFGIRAAVSMGLHCGDAVVGFAENNPTPEQLFVFGDCVSIANRLLRRVRDYAEVRAKGSVTREVADAALKMLDVDAVGLDVMDRKLLLAVIEKFAGGPVGIENLAAAIGEERDTIEDVLEPYLIQQGYLQRTLRGRMATVSAYRHFGLAQPTRSGTPDLWEQPKE